MTRKRNRPMNPRASQSGTWEANGTNGDKYAAMPWSGVAKALLMTTLKGGPWVGVLLIVLYGVWWFAAKQMDLQSSATAEQAKLTATYRDYIDAAKKSDSAIVDSMVLLTRNLDVQTQRLDHQELMLSELRKQGTEPAREMLTLMRSATELMADVPASRARTEKLLQRIAEKP